MTEPNRGQEGLRRTTRVLIHGFDPRLSVGSARPAVFRSSTYVFSSPESAERAFAIATGRAEAQVGEGIELIYSRLNHPNAKILENQVVPLERGGNQRSSLQLRHGRYHGGSTYIPSSWDVRRLHRASLRRDTTLYCRPSDDLGCKERLWSCRRRRTVDNRNSIESQSRNCPDRNAGQPHAHDDRYRRCRQHCRRTGRSAAFGHR